jgi:hypothetical protein
MLHIKFHDIGSIFPTELITQLINVSNGIGNQWRCKNMKIQHQKTIEK